MKRDFSFFSKKYKSSSHLDGIIDGIAFGWVISSEKPKIEIFKNRQKVGIFDELHPAPEISQETYRFHINLKSYNFALGDEIVLTCNKKKIKGTPLILEKNLCFAKIDYFSAYECYGWAGTVTGEIPQLKVWIDEELYDLQFEWYIRSDFRTFGISVPTGFKFRIPEKFYDGKNHKISLFDHLNQKILCKEKDFCFYVKNFFIDKADSEAIAGWIQVGENPGPVEIDIYVNNKFVNSVNANVVRPDDENIYGSGCYGFYYVFSDKEKKELINSEDRLEFSFYLKNTKFKVGDSLSSISSITIIERLEEVSQIFRLKGEKVLCNYLRLGIETLRKEFAHKMSENKILVKNLKNIENILDVIDITDIIIPVYKGKKETLQCIKSVLNAKNNSKFEVIVINDCSPDKELTEELRKLSAEHNFILIENKENLGFVKSVNLGMKLHPDRDVILLNSDTVVPDYWIDRLRNAAYQSKNIGTVTPLSNKATILSIPKPNYDNELPQGFDCKKMDALCQKVNEGVYIDIPTAIGFCMYIKRECLNEVGYFDEEKFDKGYGEENDFCLRASALGWRHIACLDLFVEHRGSVSFGEEKPERVKRALEKINQLYPDYNLRIQKFIKNDPIAPYRNRIIKELLKEKYTRYILYVIHNWGGGSLKYCKELAKGLIEEKIGALFLQPTSNGLKLFLFEEANTKCPIEIVWNGHQNIEKIAEDIKDINIFHIHINHTVGFKDLEIWDLPHLLGLSYDVTVHDYFFICPRINLINANGIFCGLPEIQECEFCLINKDLEVDINEIFEKNFDSSIKIWREFYKEKLLGARKVIAPSETARYYIEKALNINNVIVKPHPDEIRAKIKPYQKGSRLKIAIIGAIGEHKGYSQILRLVEFSNKKNLPFDFIFIGYTKNDEKLKKHLNVTITGPYENEKELAGLIRAYTPQIALFLHIWPETYTYTLSEALKNGLYPVSYNIGAPAERLKKLNFGTLIPYPSTVEEIARILLEIYEKGWEGREIILKSEYKSICKDYYGIN